MRAEVAVNSDQLSLAIGRGGQNVRLAAKLTGWKIDIKEIANSAPIEAQDEEAVDQEEQEEEEKEEANL